MRRSHILKTLCVLVLLLWTAAAFSQTDAVPEVQLRLDKAYSLKIQGNTEAALQIYDSLLPELRARGPSQQLNDALSNLADIADTAGQYDHAVELAMSARLLSASFSCWLGTLARSSGNNES